MKSSRNSLGIMFDICNIIPNEEITILENVTKSPSGHPKVAFKAVMQTLEERNQNGRFYSKAIGNDIVETLRPKARSRSLFQEIDHPSINGDKDAANRRAVTVEMKNCGSLIRDLYIQENKIIAEIETLSGFLGPDMYNLIVHDKADIGFSLRMFGRVEMEGSGGPARVVRPIRPITYDTVTNPSHATARVMEFLPENVTEFLTEGCSNNELLQENTILYDRIQFQESNESMYDYIDRVVEDVFMNMKPVIFHI